MRLADIKIDGKTVKAVDHQTREVIVEVLIENGTFDKKLLFTLVSEQDYYWDAAKFPNL